MNICTHTNTRETEYNNLPPPHPTSGAPIRTHRPIDAVDVGVTLQEELRYVFVALQRCYVESSRLFLRRQQQHTQTDRAGAACVCARA